MSTKLRNAAGTVQRLFNQPKGLTPAQWAVLEHMAWRAYDRHPYRISAQSLAFNLQLSVSAVEYALRDLKRLRFIEPQTRASLREPTEYLLLTEVDNPWFDPANIELLETEKQWRHDRAKLVKERKREGRRHSPKSVGNVVPIGDRKRRKDD